ncbi:hypothetical protein [Candidatus Nitrotoga sp. 1052]|uniref:hypothetical protein n=1 Tax=Candidatus Nitrotoga sp. 1052 TaxID=2886964 RepID=UPI001EF44536|nr:hypothetical protein [Candidatus Nitrotoga sp. 1052]
MRAFHRRLSVPSCAAPAARRCTGAMCATRAGAIHAALAKTVIPGVAYIRLDANAALPQAVERPQ